MKPTGYLETLSGEIINAVRLPTPTVIVRGGDISKPKQISFYFEKRMLLLPLFTFIQVMQAVFKIYYVLHLKYAEKTLLGVCRQRGSGHRNRRCSCSFPSYVLHVQNDCGRSFLLSRRSRRQRVQCGGAKGGLAVGRGWGAAVAKGKRGYWR